MEPPNLEIERGLRAATHDHRHIESFHRGYRNAVVVCGSSPFSNASPNRDRYGRQTPRSASVRREAALRLPSSGKLGAAGAARLSIPAHRTGTGSWSLTPGGSLPAMTNVETVGQGPSSSLTIRLSAA